MAAETRTDSTEPKVRIDKVAFARLLIASKLEGFLWDKGTGKSAYDTAFDRMFDHAQREIERDQQAA